MSKRFPLAAVLRLREQREAAEERAFTALCVELQGKKAALALLEHTIATQAAGRVAERDQVLSAAHFQAVAARRQVQRAEQAAMQQGIRLTEARRAEQQVRFLAARKDREMVAQLREKHEKAQQVAQRRQEEKQLDEMASSRHARPGQPD